MTTLVSNTFEGGTQGATVTAANSGGTSGTAFTAMSQGTGDALTYDNTHVHDGSMAMKLAIGTSAPGYGQWTVTSSGRLAYPIWVYVPSGQTGSINLGSIRNTVGNMAVVYLNFSTNLKLTVNNAAGVGIKSFANAFPLDQWVKVCLAVTPGTTTSNGIIECSYFDNTGTLLETAYNSGQTQNTGTDDAAYVRLGAIATQSVASTIWADGVNAYNVASGWADGALATPPTLATTLFGGEGYAVIDNAASAAGAGGALAFTYSQKSGIAALATDQIAPNILGIKQGSGGDAIFTVKLREAGSGRAVSSDVTVPAPPVASVTYTSGLIAVGGTWK